MHHPLFRLNSNWLWKQNISDSTNMVISLFTPLTSETLPSILFSPPQGGPTQEAGPGSGDPALSQVYAPPPSYPPPGQGPPTSAGRLPPLDFSSAHASSEYPEHPQLRVYQGPQLDGAEALTSSNTVRKEFRPSQESHAPIKSDPQWVNVRRSPLLLQVVHP